MVMRTENGSGNNKSDDYTDECEVDDSDYCDDICDNCNDNSNDCDGLGYGDSASDNMMMGMMKIKKKLMMMVR